MMPKFSELEFFLEKYFPGAIPPDRWEQFGKAFAAYVEWNPQINVISRKDFQNLAERHFLHSLAIAKLTQFVPGTRILDVGTGGGFPGIPLAIFFPEVEFHLVDSRAKKIQVVQKVVRAAGLKNVRSSAQRVEEMEDQFDFVVSRAVASWDKFIPWTRKLIHCESRNVLPNGILYLRGLEQGDEQAEGSWQAYALQDIFEEAFFSTKYLIHLSFCE